MSIAHFERIWTYGLTIPLLLCGLLGNGIIIFTILKLLRGTSPVYNLLLLLSCSDVLSIIQVFLELVVTMESNSRNLINSHSALCKLRQLGFRAPVMISAWVLSTLSIEWFRAAASPLHSRASNTTRKAVILCLVEAILSIAFCSIFAGISELQVVKFCRTRSGNTSLSAFSSFTNVSWNSSDVRSAQPYCVTFTSCTYQKSDWLDFLNVAYWLLSSAVPLVIIFVFNCLLLGTLWLHHQRSQQLQENLHQPQRGQVQHAGDRIQRRLTKVVILVSGTFLLLQLPYGLTHGPFNALYKDLSPEGLRALRQVAKLSKLANHCLTFLLYACGEQFRKAIKTLLLQCFAPLRGTVGINRFVANRSSAPSNNANTSTMLLQSQSSSLPRDSISLNTKLGCTSASCKKLHLENIG